jgi:Ca2+-binding RTX toxin-like protein
MPPMSPDQTYIVEGTNNDDLLTPTNPTSTANDRVLTFEIDAGSGNDTLFATNGPSDWPTFSAGATATTATHGLTVQNHLYGGEGNDFFFDRAGFSGLTANQAAMYGITTTMSGGVGNDTYRLVRTNTSIVEDMNAGTDQIIASRDYVNAVIAANAGVPMNPMIDMSNFGNVENFAFAPDAQNALIFVHGNSLNNVIRGNTSDDTIFGGAGADKLFGMDGADKISGGFDFDSLYGGAGNDFTNGEGGDDLLLGGADDDTLYGGTESDRLFGQDGNDSIRGDTGDDSLFGGAGDNSLEGGEGNDYLISTGMNDALYGGEGQDSLRAGTGAWIIDGGAGNDTYFLSALQNVVEATDGGLDRVVSSLVSLDGTFDGGIFNHVETLQLGGTLDLNITANLHNTTLLGNAGANMITAANVATVMRGGAGDDTLVGGSGNDVLGGGTGNDSMTGGAGDDTYVVDSANDIVIELSGGGTDTLITSTLSLISGTTAQLNNVENVTLTGALNLSATLGLNNNVLTGNDGDNNLNSGEGHDTVYGGEGADTLAGQDGNDSLDGGAGNDSLNGAFGADTLVGGDGDDTLRGDVRNDTLTGGSGADVFLFSDDGLSSTDVITDFETGVDRIDLTAFGQLENASAAPSASGGGFFAYSTSNGVSTLIVDADNNGFNEFTIILTNGPATLTAADVIYDPLTIS